MRTKLKYNVTSNLIDGLADSLIGSLNYQSALGLAYRFSYVFFLGVVSYVLSSELRFISATILAQKPSTLTTSAAPDTNEQLASAITPLDISLNTQQQNLYEDISYKLKCPTCTALSIMDSDARFSVQMKNVVKQKVSNGESEQQILAFFTNRYGNWILRQPPKKGLDALAWVIPIVFLTMGPIILFVMFWLQPKTMNTHSVRSAEKILLEFEKRIN